MQNIYWIDLFAGAGGTSTGIHLAGQKVIACVNHDAKAIASHKANHPDTLHFTEDVRDFQVVTKLQTLVNHAREQDPTAIIAIWASLECTNFSNAKGGKPRDADSRTLAEHMYMYLEALSPEYFWVENVKEFMAWGPLDANGKPISKTKGRDYIRWTKKITSFGYRYDFQIMNAANYGSVQNRERLFIQFVRPNYPISWPEQTHSKQGNDKLFPMKKWRAVKEVLDLEDQGKSIFDRKKPLCDSTLKRIYAGLEKFVTPNDKTESFLAKYFSGKPATKCISIDQPSGTIKTIDNHSLININYLQTYYGNGSVHDIETVSPTLRTKDCIAKVEAVFIDQQYGNSQPSNIDIPIGSLTSIPKFAIVNINRIPVGPESEKMHLIINPSWFGNIHNVDQPSCTIIARQDKSPLYLLTAEQRPVTCIVFKEDSEIMVKIKYFMVENNIADIKMRMLKIPELLQIQGFSKQYKLIGTQTEQKKQIGNAVEVNQSLAIANAFLNGIKNHFKL